MINNITYVIKPYKVGTKKGKSLAMIIPARFARDNQIDTSTIFILKNEFDNLENITLERIRYGEEKRTVIPTGESLEASSRRVSSRSL